MTDIFTVTAPLAIRYRDGVKRIIVRCFPYREGLIFIAPFWNRLPPEQAFEVAPGPIKGDGPWKVGDAVISVLGCQGTDPILATEYAQWQIWLQTEGRDYPDDGEIALRAAQWISRRERPPER